MRQLLMFPTYQSYQQSSLFKAQPAFQSTMVIISANVNDSPPLAEEKF
jgi:hypothetical protein